MRWYIRTVVVYGRNDEIRRVDFTPGVNIITGDSKTGKSSILDIVDYCLGSSDCGIAQGGKIRKFAAWYGMLIQTPTEQIFVARPDPGPRSSATEMFLRVQSEVDLPSANELEANTDRDTVVAELSQRLGLSQLRLAESEFDTSFSGKPTLRDLVAFMFQPQNVIANKKILFYRTEDPTYRKRLERVFPVALGIVDEEYFRLKAQAEEQRKVIHRLERELLKAEAQAGEGVDKARELYLQGVSLGVFQERPNPTWDLGTFRDKLGAAVEQGRVARQPVYGTGVNVERLVQLESEYRRHRDDSRVVEDELHQTLSLLNAAGGYKGVLESQVDRLKPVGMFAGLLTDTCPLCKHTLTELSPEMQRLKDATENIQYELSTLASVPHALEDRRRELEANLRAIQGAMRGVGGEIRAIRLAETRLAEADKTKAATDWYLGGVDQHLKTVETIVDNSALKRKLDAEKRRLETIAESLEAYDHEARLEAALRAIGRKMTAVGDQLDLEWPGAPLSLDLRRLTVVCDTPEGEPVALSRMGSGANWVSCHLSALLGLHLHFCAQDQSPVPSVLFLDQPSQAYYPAEINWEAAGHDTDRHNVRLIFEAVFDAVEASQGCLQVIVVDHADYDDWPEFRNAVGSRRFRGGRGLI